MADQDVDMEQQRVGPLALRASGPGGNPQSKETPISQNTGLSYGLPETHTTILPYTGFISARNLAHDAPLQIAIRSNSIVDMLTFRGHANFLGAAGTPGAGKEFIAAPLTTGGVISGTYPIEINAGAAERPQWKDYWFALYDYWTVLSMKYRITVLNPSNVRGSDLIVGKQMDSYSGTAGSTGNIMPLSPLIEALHFKNIVGFNLHDTMIYRKENYTPLTHKRYEQEFEYMFVFSKGKPKTFNPILIDCIHAGKVIKETYRDF